MVLWMLEILLLNVDVRHGAWTTGPGASENEMFLGEYLSYKEKLLRIIAHN